MDFVTDLAIILIAAGVFTIISRLLKQPLILGYIVAGFLVGPHLGLFPISSAEGVKLWSEIGIIFLLFALGLEFSFKKLVKVGSNALITAVVKCIGMFAVGIFAASLMHWSTMEGIFLGGLMSMSSTTIIIKAYDDMGLKNRPHATLLFGSLVFEDLIAVLLMVLLSTIAVGNTFDGMQIFMALLRLAFFMVLWFLVGIYVIPSAFKWAHRYLNDEIMLIVSIGLCFLMVTIAELVGFSSALGAFVMGSILSGTREGERIEHSISNIKDLFGAIFFVSVGMMVDPAVIAQHWLPILVIAVVAILGILCFSTLGALLVGQGLKDALHIGFSLAQLGEFAFIIAGLGCDLGVMRDFIYPVIIAVSVITTFTTPYMIKLADPVSDWLSAKLPQRILDKLNPSIDTSQRNSDAANSLWKDLLKGYLLRILIFSVILVAIQTFSSLFFAKWTLALFPMLKPTAVSFIAVSVTLLLAIPFIYGLAVVRSNDTHYATLLLKESRVNKYILRFLVILKLLLASFFATLIISSHLDITQWVGILIFVAFFVALYFARFSKRQFTFIEDKFIENLNEKELAERKSKPVTTAMEDNLSSYDVHVETFEISPQFEYVGKTLRQMPFRHTSGANVVELMRGDKCIRIPHGDEVVYPNDRLLFVGSSRQLEAVRAIIQQYTPGYEDQPLDEFIVRMVKVEEDSILANHTLRQADLRKYGCMVVSILRGGNHITNPTADDSILPGDLVWIAGEKKSCQLMFG